MSMFSNITVNLKNLFITARKKNTSYKINPKTINNDIIVKNLISLLNNNTLLSKSLLSKIQSTPIYSSISNYMQSLPNDEKVNFDALQAFFNIMTNFVGVDLVDIYFKVETDLKAIRSSITDAKSTARSSYKLNKEWASKYGELLNSGDISIKRIKGETYLYGVVESLLNEANAYINDLVPTDATTQEKAESLAKAEQDITSYLVNNTDTTVKRRRNIYDAKYTLKDYEDKVNEKFDRVKDLPITLFDDDTIISSIIGQFIKETDPAKTSLLSAFSKLVSACNITYGDLYNYVYTNLAYNYDNKKYAIGAPLLIDSVFKQYILPTFHTRSTTSYFSKGDTDDTPTLADNNISSELKNMYNVDDFNTIQGYDIRNIYELNIKDFLANFKLSKVLSGGTNLATLKSYIGSHIGVIRDTHPTDTTYSLRTYEPTEGVSSEEALDEINDYLNKNVNINIKSLSKDNLQQIRNSLLPLCAEFFKSYLLSSSQVGGKQSFHFSPSNIVPALNNSVALTNAHESYSPTDFSGDDDNEYNEGKTLSDELLESSTLPTLSDAYLSTSNAGNLFAKMHEPDTLVQSPQTAYDSTMLLLDNLAIETKGKLDSFVESIKRSIMLQVAQYRASAGSASFLYLNDPTKNKADLQQYEAVFNECVSSLATAYNKDSTITKKLQAITKNYGDKIYLFKKDIKRSEFLLKKYNTLLAFFKDSAKDINATNFLSQKLQGQQDNLFKLAKQYLTLTEQGNQEKLDSFLKTHDVDLVNSAIQCYNDTTSTNSLLSSLKNQLEANKSDASVSTITTALQNNCNNLRLKVFESKKRIADVLSTLKDQIQDQILTDVNSTFNSVVNKLSANKNLALSSGALNDMRKSLFQKFKYAVYNINPILHNDLPTKGADKNTQDINSTVSSLNKTKYLQDILSNNLDQTISYSNFCFFYDKLYDGKNIVDLTSSYWKSLPKSIQSKFDNLKAKVKNILLTRSAVKDAQPTIDASTLSDDYDKLSTSEFLYKYTRNCFSSPLLTNKERDALSYFYDMGILTINKDNINPASYIYYLNSTKSTRQALSSLLHTQYSHYLDYLMSNDNARSEFLSSVNNYLSKGHTDVINNIEDIVPFLRDNIKSVTYTRRNLNMVNLNMADDMTFKRYIIQTLFYSTFNNYINNNKSSDSKEAYTEAYTITPPSLDVNCDVAVKSRLIYLSMTNRRDIPGDTLTKWKKGLSKDLKGEDIGKSELLKQNAELSDLFSKLYYALEKGASSVSNDFVFDEKLKLTQEDVNTYKELLSKLQNNKELYAKVEELYAAINPILQLIQNNNQYLNYIDATDISNLILNTDPTSDNKESVNADTPSLPSSEKQAIISILRKLKKEINIDKIPGLLKDLVDFRKLNTLYYLLKDNRGYAYDENLPIVQEFTSIGDQQAQQALQHKQSIRESLYTTRDTGAKYYLLTADYNKLQLSNNDVSIRSKLTDYMRNNHELPTVYMFYLEHSNNDNSQVIHSVFKNLKFNRIVYRDIPITSLENTFTEISNGEAALILQYQKMPFTETKDTTSINSNEFIRNIINRNKINQKEETPEEASKTTIDNTPELSTQDTSLMDDLTKLNLEDISNRKLDTNKTAVFFNSTLVIKADNPTPMLGVNNLGQNIEDSTNLYTSPEKRKESKEERSVEGIGDKNNFGAEGVSFNTQDTNKKEYNNVPSSVICSILANLNRTNKLGSVLNIIDNSFIRPEDLEKFKLFLSRLPKHNWEFTATVESLGIGRRLMQDILNRIVVPVLEDNNLLKEE